MGRSDWVGREEEEKGDTASFYVSQHYKNTRQSLGAMGRSANWAMTAVLFSNSWKIFFSQPLGQWSQTLQHHHSGLERDICPVTTGPAPFLPLAASSFSHSPRPILHSSFVFRVRIILFTYSHSGPTKALKQLTRYIQNNNYNPVY